MNLDFLRVFLQPEEFQPFELKLTTGDVHKVTDPYQMAVTKTQVVVLDSDSGLWAHCTPHQIVSVERVLSQNNGAMSSGTDSTSS